MNHSPCQIYFYYNGKAILNESQQFIMANNAASEQASAADIHNIQPAEEEESGLIKRVQRSLATSKVMKVVLVLVLITVLILLVMVNLQGALIRAKRLFKYRPTEEVNEISGLDQSGYRTYFYYKRMMDIAKHNVENKKRFYAESTHQFDAVTFNELLGVFKVVKAIQYAKKYTAIPVKEEPQQVGDDVDPEILEKAYNYTDMFNPAANQYQCGSCYSFPITATIEYILRRDLNISVKLSQQQLIDCSSGDQSVDGCTSGNITKGFEYAMQVGLVAQDHYPYRSKNGHSYPCRNQIINNPNITKYKIKGFYTLPKDNCKAIQVELSKGNVVASMIAAGELSKYKQKQNNAFRNCPKDSFNHAITIVGQTEKQEWIIRNSWGTSFGKNGYFIARGNNTCGICTNMIVPYLNEPVNATSPNKTTPNGTKP